MLDILSAWHQYRISVLLPGLVILYLLHIGLQFVHSQTRGALESPVTNGAEKVLPNSQSKKSVDDIEALKSREKIAERIQKKAPRRIQGRKPSPRSLPRLDKETTIVLQPLVFYSTLTGATKIFAKECTASLSKTIETNQAEGLDQILQPKLFDLSDVEYDDYFTSLPKSSEPVHYFYMILIPSYNIDTNLDNFLENLRETHHDFRIDTEPLSGLVGYSVFGFGDREGWPTEQKGFCSQAKAVDRWMAKLTGRKRAYPLGMGDVKSDAPQRLDEWRAGVENILEEVASKGSLGEGVPGSGDAVESDEEEEDSKVEKEISTQTRDRDVPLNDLEAIGGTMNNTAAQKGPNDPKISPDHFLKKFSPAQTQLKDMVPKSSPTYAALTKQGYTIIGSHSGVKICRWTKSALRGRGSCYKHSFYGIASHLCMEATPSLSCSNKCIFCWRHGTNPVGTTWRWATDPPTLILSQAKSAHTQKIKALRGVPGVRADRFQDALTIRHCALSLVGEPIFYPRINELVALLHADRISTFLVCNAQHPAELAALTRVTQLYVSIDAADRDSLRRIDRPLHRDFWERFTACLDILRESRSRQRTVFRLTLVKGFNVAEAAEGYADLVAKGLPCFVEVKGVTYCGTSTSKSAGLTMQNVPFYEEVRAFVLALDAGLATRGLEYGIAAEHAHSCCVLLASRRFLVGERWCTVIDYERFFELLGQGKEFAPEDYVKETEEWALWGRGGFDPRDERVKAKGKGKNGVVEEDKRGKVVEVAEDMEVEIR